MKVPGQLRHWIPLETEVERGKGLFVPLYEVIRGNVHKLYNGMRLHSFTMVRLTRDAEVEITDDAGMGLRAASAGTGPPAAL